MSAGGAGVEGGDWAEQPRQISKRTRNARRTVINRNHLSMSKRLIISWQEGTLCGHSSGVRPLCRAFCRPFADASPYIASAPRPLVACDRSLSFVSSPLRSSYSRPSTLDHAGAPLGRLATDRPSITTCVGSAGSSDVRFRFMDAVCSAYSVSAAVERHCYGICILQRRQRFAPLVVIRQNPRRWDGKLWRRLPCV